MSDDLVEELRMGCVLHDKRWAGDTHADLGGSIDEAATDALLTEAADRIEALEAAIAAGVADGTLDCVVAGQTHNDGTPARECPDFISHPELMCAGCRIRITAREALDA